MKLLGLDYGNKRIGYAVADTVLGIAFGRDVIENKSFDFVLNQLEEIIKTDQIDKIIIGLPKFLDGQYSDQTFLTKDFASNLREKMQIEIEFFDERLSSSEAIKNLHLQNYKNKDQKGKKDVIAAEIILQKYVDQQR